MEGWEGERVMVGRRKIRKRGRDGGGGVEKEDCGERG